MKSRQKQNASSKNENGDPAVNITMAWKMLAHLGLPARYGGRAQDGSYEYLIVDPETGRLLVTGKGTTLESSMCEAALNASSLVKAG